MSGCCWSTTVSSSATCSRRCSRRAAIDVTLPRPREEALALKDKGEIFDLIVVAISTCREWTGIALAKRIKADPRWGKIPLIALSSYSNPQLVEQSRAAGFVSYVGKFDRQTLMSTLQDCCRQWGVAA